MTVTSTLTIPVQPHHIRQGVKSDVCQCAVALAVCELLGLPADGTVRVADEFAGHFPLIEVDAHGAEPAALWILGSDAVLFMLLFDAKYLPDPAPVTLTATLYHGDPDE